MQQLATTNKIIERTKGFEIFINKKPRNYN